MTARWDHLWINLRLATMAPGGTPYGAIADGALAVAGDRIAYVGRRDALPGPPDRLAAAVDRGGDARGRRRRPPRRIAAAPRRVPARGCHHRRDQVGLWARYGERAQDA